MGVLFCVSEEAKYCESLKKWMKEKKSKEIEKCTGKKKTKKEINENKSRKLFYWLM